MNKFLSLTGKVLAVDTAACAATAITLTLLIGYFAGLPPEVVSFDASIAFILTILFEIPTGFIADHYGHKKCITFGIYLEAMAVMAVFSAIISYKNGYTKMMWVLIAAEAFFDSLSNALRSGSKEAMLQSAAENQSKNMDPASAERFRTSYLSLAESYSRWIPISTTAVVVGLTIAFEYYCKGGIYLLIIVAFGWFYLNRIYNQFNEYVKEPESKSSIESLSIKMRINSFFEIFSQRKIQTYFLTIMLFLAMFYNVLVLINLLLCFLREHIMFEKEMVLIETLIVTTMILLGKIIRSYFVPWISSKISATESSILGGFFAILWSLILIFHGMIPHQYKIYVLSITVLFSEIPIGMVLRSTQMLSMNEINSEVRATYRRYVQKMCLEKLSGLRFSPDTINKFPS
ncbi:MAG: MFS transporter [Bacteriovoracaceae bacterium]|nr:MFS transporter [Bacteriovoracaceae bacterium]